ncbi:MAG: MazG family protein [Lachnospiraceae bacterium]|nr:MazG family protein [Lachnospiraceae bacterium]
MPDMNFVTDKREKYTFEELTGIIAALRSPEGGCPWDRVQTFESMKQYLVNETQEVLQAVEKQDADNLCEELGDVLLQVLLYSQIASDNGLFDISDVVDSISRKMIRRHPHVFAGKPFSSREELNDMWEEIKKQEKSQKTHGKRGCDTTKP